jgi:ribonuclease P protein component
MSSEGRCEAHLPAKQPSSLPQARFPRSDAHQGRPPHRVQPPSTRSGEAVGVTSVDGGHRRLSHGADITAVLRGRRQRAGRLVVAHAALRPDDDADRARVAVIASRRVGGAVQRNRAKRLLREAVRLLPLRPGVDLVLVARPACAPARFEAVRAEVAELSRDLDVLVATATAGAEA